MDNPDIIDLPARLDGRDPSQILAPNEEQEAQEKSLAVMFASGELNVFIRGRLRWDGKVHSGFDYHVFEETPGELVQPAEWQESPAGQRRCSSTSRVILCRFCGSAGEPQTEPTRHEHNESKTARKYDEDFKRAAVALANEPGKKDEEVARDLGVSAWSIWRWRRQYGPRKAGAAAAPATPVAAGAAPEELERANRALRRENEELRQQREILKKALAIFSTSPR